MISGFFRSLQAYSKSIKYLSKPWVFKYLMLSGFISLLVFGVLCGVVYVFGGDLGYNILGNFYDGDAPNWLIFLVGGFAKFILWASLFLIMKYIILIVSAPFMSALSEKLEEKISPGYKDPKPNQLYSTIRGVRLATSNIVREILFTFPLFLLSFIPAFTIFTTALIFLIQAYYAGFGNIDFFMERRFSSQEARRFISKRKGLAIGNGAIFLLLFIIPVVGAFIAPTMATLAATIACVSLDEYNTSMEYDNF